MAVLGEPSRLSCQCLSWSSRLVVIYVMPRLRIVVPMPKGMPYKINGEKNGKSKSTVGESFWDLVGSHWSYSLRLRKNIQ
eukprot:scaffold10102_cov36-Cyclotella_meneghiniana.AAC.1